MAALGKIRNHGALLVGIIGLGLFAFIAEEAFRSCESTKNTERQQIAEVLGQKVSYQEFQEMVDEYLDVIKLQQGRENLGEDEMNQVRDMVWNQYIQTSLIAKEAEKVGLRVTDDEIRNILNEGTNQMLMQTPFMNQTTGRFDANMLKQFLNEYKKVQSTSPQQAEQMRVIYNYWNFIEKTLRQQTLTQKYQALLGNAFLSNKIEAQQAYAEENSEASVQLAVLPYSSIADKDVKVEDSDLKAKYDELKPRFKQMEETRDLKYVSVKVTASAADRAALNKQTQDFVAQLATAEDPSEIVRKSGSDVPYLGVPVLKSAFPYDIQQMLDSVAVGSTSALKTNTQDNTLNAVRLISKQELPDSVEFASISVGGETAEAAHTRADSIMKALAADPAQWEALAKKYGQTGEKQWITTAQYQNTNSVGADQKAYLNALNTIQTGETKKLEISNGDIIIKVTDRKAFQTKYVAAVIKVDIDFSKETYSQAYNKFSQYVSESRDLASLEKNAKKNGYQVQDLTDVVAAQHNIARIHGTHEALKWAFDAKENEVSPLYECGENDNLLVLVLTKIHEKGYRGLDDPQVKDLIKQEVIKDKKAEKLMAKLNGVKNIAEAKAKGAQLTSLDQVTFAAPAFVQLTTSSEPALSGAIAAVKQGASCAKPVKGNGGVFFFTVATKKNRPGKYEEQVYQSKMSQRAMQMASGFMQGLYEKAEVKDNRYLFF